MQRQSTRLWANQERTCSFRFASDTEASTDAWEARVDFPKRAIESARGSESKETAAAWRMNAALREAEFDNMARSRQEIAPALAEGPTRDVSVLAALAFSRIGDINRAERMARDLAERFPLNTAINRYWLPAIYASIEIRRDNWRRLSKTSHDFSV